VGRPDVVPQDLCPSSLRAGQEGLHRVRGRAPGGGGLPERPAAGRAQERFLTLRPGSHAAPESRRGERPGRDVRQPFPEGPLGRRVARGLAAGRESRRSGRSRAVRRHPGRQSGRDDRGLQSDDPRFPGGPAGRPDPVEQPALAPCAWGHLSQRAVAHRGSPPHLAAPDQLPGHGRPLRVHAGPLRGIRDRRHRGPGPERAIHKTAYRGDRRGPRPGGSARPVRHCQRGPGTRGQGDLQDGGQAPRSQAVGARPSLHVPGRAPAQGGRPDRGHL